MATSAQHPTPSSVLQPSEKVPQPPALVQDDPTTVEAIRQRLAPDSRISRIFRRTKLISRRNLGKNLEPADKAPIDAGSLATTTTSIPDRAPIFLSDNAIRREDDGTTDRYQWAIVYENQRGMTLFSIPYYSAMSLLPTDPSAFTLPNSSHRRSEQPPVTLTTYSLPDGNWRWVSREWMIDMRSESNIVQHDGFEYNWVFRRHKWRAEVGFLSAGGWVRRRRWVRLMMQPGKNQPHIDSEACTSSSSASSSTDLIRRSLVSSNLSGLTDHHVTVGTVWHGNEGDWRRCRSLMSRYGRDGRKIDLWRIWLGFYHPSYQDQFTDQTHFGKGKGKQKQWSEDDDLLPSQYLEPDAASHRSIAPPPREYIITALHNHGYDLLQLFVYPDSRVELLKLLGQAGLLPDLGVSIGSNFSTSQVEFWSYTSSLAEELKRLEINSITFTTDSSSLSPPSQLSSDNEQD